jgi:UV DNA damage endonuclease
MIRKTFDSKGLNYVSELSLQNVRDLIEVIKWNEKNGINLYRMSSDMFPWSSEYNFDDLPDIGKIKNLLNGLGNLVRQYNHRLSFHPGPFNVLASPSENVVKKTISELDKHSEIMDMIGLPVSPFSKINIHVGATYGDKETAAATWCKNFRRLSDGVRSRLTIENDDKATMFSVADLHRLIHTPTGIPIVFDYHHHTFNTGDLSESAALYLAASTWNGIIPAVHYSESKALHENNPKLNPRAHSDYINGPINLHGLDVDVMIEAKAKELTLLEFRKKKNILL